MNSPRNLAKPKALVTAAFIIMVAVNAMANLLPINGVSTGDISDSFPNLFAPAGSTFAIWGLIYLLLAAYTVYQWSLPSPQSSLSTHTMQNVRAYFIFSSLANAAWIFAWHYYVIWLSVLLMLVILISLIYISQELSQSKLTTMDWILVRLPFSVYFGWITVATIANLTVLLVDWGWSGFGLSPTVWTVIAIGLGLIIGMTAAFKQKDIAYALVIMWAYAGILNKHLAQEGFAGRYPAVITAVVISLLVIVLTIAAIFWRGKSEGQIDILDSEET